MGITLPTVLGVGTKLDFRWDSALFQKGNGARGILKTCGPAVLAALCIVLICRSRPTAAQATTGLIYTTVGGANGDGGPATDAVVDPHGVAVCAELPGVPPNLYVADTKGNRVRKIDGLTGVVSTMAGTGVAGFSGDGGLGVEAQLAFPADVACDSNGNLYIVDGGSSRRVRKLDTAGGITTVAGNGSSGFSGDDGPATQAGITPYAVALDASGNLYIADADNRRVRKVDTQGIITTVAGTGVYGYAREGQTAVQAELGFPSGVAVDTQGRLYIVDYNNKVVYRVANGLINTIAGNYIPRFDGDGGPALNASLLFPNRVALDVSGNVYISDQGNNRVRRVDAITGIITSIAGNGSIGSTGDGGPGTQASLFPLHAIAADQLGNLYIATSVSTSDVWSTDNRVRKLNAAGIISTFAGISHTGDGGPALDAIVDPQGLATERVAGPRNLYIADGRNNQVRRVDAITGTITRIAGTGVAGFSGDNGPALNAQLSDPVAVALDRAGNVFIGDQNSSRVRRIDTRGSITTVAGNGTFGYSGDGGAAIDAAISYPTGIGVDDGGNLYIADRYNYRIRKVTPQGVITTFAGDGTFNPSAPPGDGSQATQVQLGVPTDVVAAPDGSLYIAEFGSHRVRKVRSNGIIVTIAGNGNYGSSGDGGLAVNALLNGPYRLALDAQGNLFVSDFANDRVRRIDVTTGIITTVAGTGMAGVEGDGGPAILANLYGATGLAVGASDSLYIAQADGARVRVVVSAAAASPTATYTPTALPSATATGTRTHTPTASPTRTPTATASSTPTRTVTVTSTSTATPTFTATVSPTRTPTATASPTPTRTVTATSTSTLTPTLTATISPTRTPTPTATLVPTATPTPTPTRSLTATSTVTPTRTPTPTSTTTARSTATSTPSHTPTITATPTPTDTRKATATPSPTDTLTPIPTATASHTVAPTAVSCVGDCGGDGTVTVGDLLTMVNVALGNTPVSTCRVGDPNGDGQIVVNEIVMSVENALDGCP